MMTLSRDMDGRNSISLFARACLNCQEFVETMLHCLMLAKQDSCGTALLLRVAPAANTWEVDE